MALIECSECKKEISDKAQSCPHCGNPINATSTNQEEILCCPKCGSSQLHSDKKGFSGGKAVAGAVLTGGIGLLAGTIGSGDIKITCLKCGNKFNTGEARIKYPNNGAGCQIDSELKEMWAKGETLCAIKRYKDYSGANLAQAKEYVEKLNGVNKTSDGGGCYIATAVYGSYDAPQVMTLRQFRDDVLQKYYLGRKFIALYYKHSPKYAEQLKYHNRINRVVRSILNKWVNHLDSNSK